MMMSAAGQLFLNGILILDISKEAMAGEAEGDNEEALREFFEGSGVAPVIKLVEKGWTWSEAKDLWEAESRRIRRLVRRLYDEQVEDGASRDDAARGAAAAGFAADTLGLFEHPDGIQVSDTAIFLQPVGLQPVYVFNRPAPENDDETNDEKTARARRRALNRATYLYERLNGAEGPAFVFHRAPGGMACFTGSGEVARVLDQLEQMRQNPSRYVRGNLTQHQAKLILHAEGVLVDW